jgi:hypothetical protein
MHSSLRGGICHQRRFRSKKRWLNRIVKDMWKCGSEVLRQVSRLKIYSGILEIYVVELGILFYKED